MTRFASADAGVAAASVPEIARLADASIGWLPQGFRTRGALVQPLPICYRPALGGMTDDSRERAGVLARLPLTDVVGLPVERGRTSADLWSCAAPRALRHRPRGVLANQRLVVLERGVERPMSALV